MHIFPTVFPEEKINKAEMLKDRSFKNEQRPIKWITPMSCVLKLLANLGRKINLLQECSTLGAFHLDTAMVTSSSADMNIWG